MGERTYSTFVPISIAVCISILLELANYLFLHGSQSFNVAAITIYIALIIYFSFRFGRRGGLSTVLLTVLYYVYIIGNRGLQGDRLTSALTSTVILGGLYFVIAYIIGWLKERIDTLIEHEVNAYKRLATIIRQLPVGIVIADVEGRVIESNTRMHKIIGGKLRPGSLLGKDLYRLVYPHNHILVSDKDYPIQRALRSHDVVNNEYEVVQKSDKHVPVLVSSSPITNRRSEVVAAVAIYQDITLQKDLEKRKDDFVAIASHELKTPITSLSLYLGILKLKVKEGNVRAVSQAIESIEKQTGNLTNVITNLLDVSRYQTGKMTYTSERFFMDELVKEVVDALAGVSPAHHLVIHHTRHLLVEGDRHRVYQVLSNLITNAFKYSLEGTTVTVTLVKDGKYVKAAVKDKGMGIAPLQQKKIFTKLYQAHDATIDTYPGFGMGLYIAKEIVKHHKGRIWVESKVGKGSTFYFTLPLVSRRFSSGK